jgi:hypothetical protein
MRLKKIGLKINGLGRETRRLKFENAVKRGNAFWFQRAVLGDLAFL